MKIFKKAKDGGPESPVDAYFLIEWKKYFSIALLRFNIGSREAFHSHAFNAWTWFICGDLIEERYKGTLLRYKRSILPKITTRDNIHRVLAQEISWCLTIRGPWKDTWTEVRNDSFVTLTHGRKEI